MQRPFAGLRPMERNVNGDVFANVATADGVVVSAHNAPALVATFAKTSPSVAANPRRASAA